MLFVLVWIVSTIYLALALALCVIVLLAVYWVGTKLVEQFESSRREPPPPPPSGSKRRAR